MKINEIKKELYKQKPSAQFVNYQHGILHYTTIIRVPNVIPSDMNINFEIPVADTDTADFRAVEPAQQLIRWLKIFSDQE